jgi:methyltransferase (TIGR00027 family)
MGRALAHGRSEVTRYADPTAMVLLPESARRQVEAMRTGKPTSLRDGLKRAHLAKLTDMMVARTVEIDEAVRAAASPQVVILGAGLDGRAWRMAELANVTVFEVDHPDSQRDKRARTGGLTQLAGEVRFVPVDFTRDDLDQSLAAAGHDPERPTTWIWEGVVMYLTLADIEATLAVVARRSAAHSRLVILYHTPSWLLTLVDFVVSRLGEPLRSAFGRDQTAALLAKHGFSASRDIGMRSAGQALSPALGRRLRMMNHLRLVTADR